LNYAFMMITGDSPGRPKEYLPYQPAGMVPPEPVASTMASGARPSRRHCPQSSCAAVHARAPRGHRRRRVGWDRGAQVWCAYEAGFTARHDSAWASTRSTICAQQPVRRHAYHHVAAGIHAAAGCARPPSKAPSHLKHPSLTSCSGSTARGALLAIISACSSAG
jgi:hypothetical protein